MKDWKNSLELNFNSSDGSTFNYQCSVFSSNIHGNKLNCYYENWDLYNPKGIYNLNSIMSLGKENEFIINDSQISQFTFYGYEYLLPLFENIQYFYVSEKGSKLIIHNDPDYEIDEKVPNIFPSNQSKEHLSNCKKEKYYSRGGLYNLIICELTENEILKFNKDTKVEIDYNYYCGYIDSTYTYVYKLDKTKYPVFRVKSAFLERVQIINYYTQFYLIADIEGSLSGFNKGQMFAGFANIEYDNRNITHIIVCYAEIPDDVSKNYSII